MGLGPEHASGQRSRFWYGSDGQRYKREDGNQRTLYIGSVEIVTGGGDNFIRRYVAGVMVQEIRHGAASNRYLFHDHLGSVVRVTNSSGAVVEGTDFGAFGERRGFASPLFNPEPLSATPRGYTGHEHVEAFGLVHMNGRIYEPRLGRFLQPDPFVQEPGNLQNHNRYTYVWNNPLNATDPSGYLGVRERQWLGVAITIAAVATQQYWAAGWVGSANATAYTIMAYGAVGAVSGGISTQSTSGALRGAFTAMVLGNGGLGWAPGSWQAVAASATVGGVVSHLQGGKFGHSFAAAGATALLMPSIGQINGPVTRTLTAAMVGGSISAATGGKFANGAVMGAMQTALSAPAEPVSEEGSEYTFSDEVSPSRAMRRRMRLTEGDGTRAMEITLTLSPGRGIDEATARRYIDQAKDGWNVKIVGDDGVARTFRLNLEYVPRRGDLRLLPCTPSVCTTGMGAAVLGGPRMWYSPFGRPDTPAHEIGHVLGFRHNRAYGTGSLMSGDWDRQVTQEDFDLLWRGYRGGR